jgi:hypothetical protein
MIVEYTFKETPLKMKIPLSNKTEKTANPYRNTTVFETKKEKNLITITIKE